MSEEAREAVYCQGAYRGLPCRRFLGSFVFVLGGLICPKCGQWNEVEIAKTEKVC